MPYALTALLVFLFSALLAAALWALWRAIEAAMGGVPPQQ